jgi:predicted dehydrogenase
MTSKTYRVGIVGLSGRIAVGAPDPAPRPLQNEINNSHTYCLSLTAGVDIVGVCDLVPELLDGFQRRWGDRWPNAKPYTDYREMLEKEGLDILSVVTGDDKHADIAVDGVEAGVKGLFVEKPLATTLADADRILDACEKRGVPISVGHIQRWMQPYHAVRETIRMGDIGPLHNIIAVLGGPRAMLFRNGTHTLDGICFFAESDPIQVFARLEDGFEDWDKYKGDGGKLPMNDPGVSGFIMFRNGIRAYFSANKNTITGSTYEIAGPKGKILFDRGAGLADLLQADGPRETKRHRLRLGRTPYYGGDFEIVSYVAAYVELVGLIENGGQGVSTGREARKAVQIMTGFLKSQQAGSALVDVDD